jgi:hypothetical protein
LFTETLGYNTAAKKLEIEVCGSETFTVNNGLIDYYMFGSFGTS